MDISREEANRCGGEVDVESSILIEQSPPITGNG